MRLLLILLILATPLSSQAEVEITHFKSGLACTKITPTPESPGWICQPTEEILVTDQGVCVFNGNKMPCTWMGFEFDYKGASKGEKLQCVVESSVPVNIGNPKQLVAENARLHPYELPLESESGHFFNPQYIGFSVARKGSETHVDKGSCKSNGRVVFEYRFNIRYPAVDE
jgi:hypothetical protein